MKSRIYLAAPLSDKEDRERNERLAERLRSLGYKVFLPQGAGIFAEELLRCNGDKYEAMRRLNAIDREALLRADLAIAYTEREKGLSEGMIWEMGYMRGINKPVYLYNPLDLFICQMVHINTPCFTDFDTMIEYIKRSDYV